MKCLFPLLLLLTICTEAKVHIVNTITKRYSQRHNLDDVALQVTDLLEYLSQGPTEGKSLVLHLNPALPATLQNTLLKQHPLPPPSPAPLLHIVLYATPTNNSTPLWFPEVHAPQNVLLINFDSSLSGDLLLNQPMLRTVLNFALITRPQTYSSSLAVYTLRPFCSMSPHLLGRWIPEHFLVWTSLFPDRFPSTCRPTFHLASWFADSPYLYLEANRIPHAGINMAVLGVLADKINFTYTVIDKPEDGKWGAIEDGRWVGLLGLVDRGECEFTLNCFYYSEERLASFDPAEPFFEDAISVFLQYPEPYPRWTSIVRPFSPSVWGTLLVALIFCSIVMNQAVSDGMGEVRWVPLRALLSQAATPSVSLPRLLAGLWMMTCLVITTSFKSNLISIFTNPAFPPLITSIDQLVASSIRLTAPDHGSYASDLLKRGEGPTLRMFKGRNDLYLEETKVVAAMEAGTHGFFESATHVIMKLNNKYKMKNWYKVREDFLTGRVAWFFRKYTPWKYKIDVNTKRLKEAGIVNYFYKRELVSLGVRRSGRQKDVWQPLSTDHLQGLFWLLGLACAATSLLFITEILHSKLETSYKRNAQHGTL